MTIQKALSQGAKILKNKSDTSQLDAEILLAFVLDQPKEFLYTHPEISLTDEKVKKFNQLIQKRSQGEPVAYLTNIKEFFGFDFYVDSRVLIPRPDTEILVEAVLQQAQAGQTIADIGTGSGCIAISLALKRPDLKIIASDISTDALAVAEHNVKNLKAQVELLTGNLLEPIQQKKIDIIVANLPYIEQSRLDAQPNLKYEPRLALFGGSFGLEVYTTFFQQLSSLPNQPSQVFIEVDPEQIDAIAILVKELFPDSLIEIKPDLAGLDRVMIISLTNAGHA